MLLTTFATLATLLSPADTVILRGVALPTTAAVPMAKVLATPTTYTKAPVLVEGVIVKSCTVEGCWMQLAPSAEETGVRVTFKDESFLIPLNAAGMTAKAQLPFFPPTPLNMAVWEDVGTDAPPAPPENKDQLAGLFHWPAAEDTQ